MALDKAARRARREARREKQRAANTGRAKAMHAARLAFERRLKKGEAALPPMPQRQLQQLYVGCSGWCYFALKNARELRRQLTASRRGQSASSRQRLSR